MFKIYDESGSLNERGVYSRICKEPESPNEAS